MVNRGEEKVWVQINVVPRSTGNTNSGTRELTLKCKLKCYFKPMNIPLGVSPSKGKQGTTRGKEKIFGPRWESNTLIYTSAIIHLSVGESGGYLPSRLALGKYPPLSTSTSVNNC